MESSSRLRHPFTTARRRKFELDTHFTTLKMLAASRTDPVQAVIPILGNAKNETFDPETGSTVAQFPRGRAVEWWHGVFQDFPELRGRFPCSQQFAPYDDAAELREESR